MPLPMLLIRPSCITVKYHSTAAGLLGPAVKLILNQYQLDLSRIKASGPKNNILKSDVLAFIKQQQLKPVEIKISSPVQQSPVIQKQKSRSASAPGITRKGVRSGFVDISISSTSQTINKNLSQTKVAVPHYYLTAEIEVDELLKVRDELNEFLVQNLKNKEMKKLTIDDFIIKACALSCLKVPEVNSSFFNDYIRQNKIVNIGVTVNSDVGLLKPVIQKVNKKGLLAISAKLSEYMSKAKKSQIQQKQLENGTFTISNLGNNESIDSFTEIVSSSQSCILGVGEIVKEVVSEEESSHNVVTKMQVTLSCDHRVVDGAVGAVWLKHFKEYLEKPHTMLL